MRKSKTIAIDMDDPVGFVSATTCVSEDGTLIRTTEKTEQVSLKKTDPNSFTYQSYSKQIDDILF